MNRLFKYALLLSLIVTMISLSFVTSSAVTNDSDMDSAYEQFLENFPEDSSQENFDGFQSPEECEQYANEYAEDMNERMMEQFNEAVQAQDDEFDDIEQEIERGARRVHKASTVFFVVWIVLAVTILLGVIAEIVYIFIVAPKCGMSRLWALVPLVSSLFGLIIFIIVRSAKKSNTTSSTKTITCPTCGSVHPQDTSECNICGAKLK